ncbi:MAG: M4 family metallopeptidase [Anaerolineae bacterium]|nr:M4 family metallopeptidase [Anaerolineae bacterium]
MCETTAHRHSIFCVLPPYILQAIAQNVTKDQANAALQTLMTDTTFRSFRSQVAGEVVIQSVMGAEPTSKQRTIYNTNNSQNLPGTKVRGEGDKASGDPEVDEAYDGLGDTYDFYWDVFSRHSIDDAGLPLNATVHFDNKYDNAFWNGQQMVFGDGDGVLFNRFTISVDVIGHELTHGVTQNEAQLQYLNQPGALNESVSDVFGSLVKQYKLKQTADKADWLIGEGLLAKKVKGVALRSMKAPGTAYNDPTLGKDPQPADMKHFVKTFDDNGGVHINSGIPNHAFYLAATKIGGHAWEKAGHIWYDTLRDAKLRPNATFLRFAKLTVDNAARLYGIKSAERTAVKEAWAEVGVVVK